MVEQSKSLTKDIPPPPADSVEVYVELEEEDLHFLDAIIEGYDGVANVRREYRVVEGDKQFRILTSPSYLDRVIEIIRDLRRFIFVGRIIVEGKSS